MAEEQPADLFEFMRERDPAGTPLADRMRPRSLDTFVGQAHLVAPGRVLRELIAADRVPSMILWGPPGSGKTTLARIVANGSRAVFEVLSATSSGVKEIRGAVERARRRRAHEDRSTVLFIDEIHRFHKGQQDALLPHVEGGVCTLIGATTENPSFEVNSALLSRARVFQLRELQDSDLIEVMQRALGEAELGLGGRGLTVEASALDAIAVAAAGDARRALNTLESAADLVAGRDQPITVAVAAEALGRRSLRHDKGGEDHYNVVSAFIKSMRASDPDAAVYWLARMLEAGEDPMFVARRLVIFASEDVGNAEPNALVVATSAASATHQIGMPEAVLPLTQATLFLAYAPKSNSALRAYRAAREDVTRHGALPVPLDIRNAVTQLMKSSGYGDGYRYPHDAADGVDREHQSHLPEALATARYAAPGVLGWEAHAAERLERLRARDPDDSDA